MPLTVAIIGAGPLGRWLAFSAARAGHRVTLEDVMPASLHHARESLRLQLGPESMPNVTFASTVEDAVREADLAIDCVPDELESKLEILWLLDRMAPPRTVLATPTTRMSITDLADCTYRQAQCVAIVADASALQSEANLKIKLLATKKTSEETIALVRGFWASLGFTPHFETEASAQV